MQEGAGSDLAERFYDDDRYRGIPSGPPGLVGRMRARARAGRPEAAWPPATGDDVDMGSVLAAEHDQHVQADEARG